MDTQVLIAGAGPTGMTLALELAGAGVECRLLDRAAAPPATSRALAVQPRTLELLEPAGVAREIERRGIPQTGIQLRTRGRLLARLEHELYPYRATCLAQTEVEAALREALADRGVLIEAGTEVLGVEPRDGHVLVRTGAGEARAAYVVGCDGAHSAVRHALGIAFTGSALPETNLMADVEADWDLDGGDVRIWFDADGALVVLHQPAGVWRLIASVPDPDAMPSEAFFREVLSRRASLQPRRLEFRWMSTFRVHTRLAAAYRKGRVLLAGDAAHVHSPVGGQGMNLGIQDAVNLGWKLAQVLRGGPDALLDSYEAERRPVARTVLRATEPLTRIGVASTPVKRVARDHLLPLVLSLPPIRRSIARQASGMALTYAASPLSGPGGGARPPFRRGFYTRSWELFGDRSGGGVLVRPDNYVGARFKRDAARAAAAYLAARVGDVALVDGGRGLPEEEARTPEPVLVS